MKSITLGCFSMPVAVLIKTCKHQGPGVCLALFFFPGYSECGVAEKFTSSPTCLWPLCTGWGSPSSAIRAPEAPGSSDAGRAQRDLTQGSVTPGAAGPVALPRVSEWVPPTLPRAGHSCSLCQPPAGRAGTAPSLNRSSPRQTWGKDSVPCTHPALTAWPPQSPKELP